ncbi:MAG: thioredoxin family protein [Halolamina sp.]|uniref:thioredoxin family protein n=1 Tax=Halolamina sp. TaxID=1940283 RepID=UPI002FC3A5B1
MSATNEAPMRLESREELEQLVADHDRVLVDFYTKGCPLCQSIEPVIGNVAKVSDVTVAMLNPRESPGLIEEFNIKSVPMLVLFEEGEEVDRMADGFRGTDAIIEFVDG